eukprot:11171960-Lingulodinium_polyedra.AAC.1
MVLGRDTSAHQPAGVTANAGESSNPAELQKSLGLPRTPDTEAPDLALGGVQTQITSPLGPKRGEAA